MARPTTQASTTQLKNMFKAQAGGSPRSDLQPTTAPHALQNAPPRSATQSRGPPLAYKAPPPQVAQEIIPRQHRELMRYQQSLSVQKRHRHQHPGPDHHNRWKKPQDKHYRSRSTQTIAQVKTHKTKPHILTQPFALYARYSGASTT